MAFQNGRIPASALAPIPGNGRLLRRAARAYTAMHIVALRHGVSLVLIEGPIRRTYREFAAQVAARTMWCNAGKCGNAAVPGTSNHGWGLAVDLATFAQRSIVDRIGRAFGWAKVWSDAPQEWWHLKYNSAIPLPPMFPRTLKPGARGKTVGLLQAHLRSNGRAGRRPFSRVPAKGKLGRGHYGRATVRAVKHFQRQHNLKPDGLVGPHTWRKLGVKPS